MLAHRCILARAKGRPRARAASPPQGTGHVPQFQSERARGARPCVADARVGMPCRRAQGRPEMGEVWPPPQDRVHAVQPLTTQSTGHAVCVLHLRDSECAPHVCPPYATSRTIVRTRICSPPPQRLEQAPQPDHALRAQSLGQCGVSLHARTCLSGSGHSAPAFFAARSHVRSGVDIRAARDGAARPRAPGRSFVVLGFGYEHAWSLHGRASLSDVQGRPRFLGATTMARRRTCSPPPHEREHSLHAAHIPTWQCREDFSRR